MDDISKIDKNLKVETSIQKEDIRFFDARWAPFKIYGGRYDNGLYRRMPETVAKATSESVHSLHKHTAGLRLRFKTNSDYVAIKAEMPQAWKMPHFAITGSCGFDLYANGKYVRSFIPPVNIQNGYESVIEFGNKKMRDVIIHFPLYSEVSALYVGISNKAQLCEGEEYADVKPIVYYGSSITQGGCASRPGTCYENVISQRLNVDHINLGFSGSARAEDAMVEYISGLDMSVFVMDYDHNSPSEEHLQSTHEKMFLKIRERNKELPIIIMPRPKRYLSPFEKRRFEIIKGTRR